jgi:hypothetical protein
MSRPTARGNIWNVGCMASGVKEVSMWLQIGLALALGGSALAQSNDTRTDEQKQTGDTVDQIPNDVPKNPMTTPESQRNLDTNPVNPPSDSDKATPPSDNKPKDTNEK